MTHEEFAKADLPPQLPRDDVIAILADVYSGNLTGLVERAAAFKRMAASFREMGEASIRFADACDGYANGCLMLTPSEGPTQ